jgi:Fur family ferric uptake transcriptional regulator
MAALTTATFAVMQPDCTSELAMRRLFYEHLACQAVDFNPERLASRTARAVVLRRSLDAAGRRAGCGLLARAERGRLAAMARNARLLRDDDLRELLTSRGLRVTEQRMTILRELARLRIPTSHPELTDRIAGEGLDRATVYRNLVSLTEAGLLVRTQLGDNVWRFELPKSTSTEHGAHPHFVCNDCGTIACLPSSSVSLRGEAARKQVADVQLRGRCAGCVRA